MLAESVNFSTAFKVIGVLIGVVYGASMYQSSIEQRIEKKADAQDVQALQAKLEQMANDLTTIRLILCDGKPADSYCRTR